MANNVQKKADSTPSFKEGLVTYFKGVKSEWGKVTWPEKNQVVVETGIVIFVVAAFTIAVYLMDILFKWLLGLITR